MATSKKVGSKVSEECEQKFKS